jgi:hypothetical protein
VLLYILLGHLIKAARQPNKGFLEMQGRPHLPRILVPVALKNIFTQPRPKAVARELEQSAKSRQLQQTESIQNLTPSSINTVYLSWH